MEVVLLLLIQELKMEQWFLKNKTMRKILFLLVWSAIIPQAFAQVLYNNGATITVKETTVRNGNVETNATVYVRGDITNTGINGIITNDGEIQVTGDWVQNDNAQLVSTGDEVFIGAESGTVDAVYNKYTQRISGNTVNAFTGSNYDFYNLIIKKPSRTTGNLSIIELGKNTEIGNMIKWVNTSGGVIRTDIVTRNDAGENYQYELYLKNPDPASLVGYTTTVGGINNYIEGKLRRQVDRIGNYYFPIGVDPAHSIGGMNACQISFTSIPTNSGILGYLEKSNLYPLNLGQFYGDIGTDPGPSGGPFTTCIGGPDGILDKMVPTKHQNYQWSLTPNTAGTFQYTLEVIPTVACENSGIGEDVSAGCLTPYAGRSMTWLAHNGVPLGNPTTTINPAPLFPGPGYAVVPPSNYKIISGQSGFSKFRLHGVLLLNTVLPIELISFLLSPIDNEYFALQWQTASEINNDYFILERSIDGISFTSVTSIDGNGTSNQLHTYSYDDYNVTVNKVYYYRLKQIDYDGSYIYSSIISGRLSGSPTITMYPNPTNGLVQSTIMFDQVEVFTELGQLVKTVSSSNTVDISNLANALYLIKLYSGDKIYYFEIVKK